MKILRYFLILLIVAAQVAYLVHSYGERTREIENAPHLVLKCRQYDPRDILRGDYFAIDTDFLQLDFNSPVWGKSLYWGAAEMLKSIDSSLTEEDAERIKFAPREKAADDAVDLASLEYKPVAVFWKQGEDGIHTAVRVEAIGTAADAPAEGEIRTRMDVSYVSFDSHTDYSREETSTDRVYADFRFTGMGRHDRCLRFYIPDNMTPSDYEIPEDWKDKFSVVLVYREDGTIIPHQLYVDGKPYLEAVKTLPRKQGHSRYNTSLYHDSHSGEEVVPVAVPDKEEAAGEEKAEQTAEQTEQPSEEVKPEEPQPEVQPQPAEQPQTVEEPQPEPQQPAEEVQQPQPEQPQTVEEPQPEPQQPAEEVQQPQPEPQPQAQEKPAPAPSPEASAPVENDEI